MLQYQYVPYHFVGKLCLIACFFTFTLTVSGRHISYPPTASTTDHILDRRLQGAWKMVIESVDPFDNPTGNQIKVFSKGYFMLAVYDSRRREYYVSAGGTYTIRNGVYSEYVIFHAYDPDLVGKTFTFKLDISRDWFRQQGYVTYQDIRVELDEEYERIDYGVETPVAGVWRLEYPNNPSTTVLRLMAGTVFQEVEYDNRSREIISAIGGAYTYRNGQVKAVIHFHKRNRDAVFKEWLYESDYSGDKWVLSYRSSRGIVREEWRRLD